MNLPSLRHLHPSSPTLFLALFIMLVGFSFAFSVPADAQDSGESPTSNGAPTITWSNLSIQDGVYPDVMGQVLPIVNSFLTSYLPYSVGIFGLGWFLRGMGR